MTEKLKKGKASTNGASRSGKPTKKASKSSAKVKEMTAREATLRAWQKTYENRDKRVG